MNKPVQGSGDRLITASIRKALERPFGKLLAPRKLLAALKNPKAPIIAVGDISTLLLMRNGITPDVSFFDFTCKRKPIMAEDKRELLFMRGKLIKITNPAGMISAELMRTTKAILIGRLKENVKVLVDGEEDLAAIPCMMFAPRGSFIVYGQPDRGAVLIKLRGEDRLKAQAIYKNSKAASIGKAGKRDRKLPVKASGKKQKKERK
ncbi:MAG: GTP-dependent dephospho-CoA kinase family protein [Candidatus Micrarchaeota archaeon]